MEEKNVMILGSGRLAFRLSGLFSEKGIRVIVIDSKEFKEREETVVEESSMDYARELLIRKGIRSVSAVCIVDSEDAVNIYLLMAVLAAKEDIPIYASFFNESLVSALAIRHRNIKLFNPADIVSRLFVEAIPKSMSKNEEVKTLTTYQDSPSDTLIFWLTTAFLWLMVSGACFFRWTQPIDWQTSFYLVVTLITGNFNDADLVSNNYPVLLTGLMLATFAYTIMVLSFIFDHILKRRNEILMYGRKRYHKRGHVIVCGLGRVGYAIVQDLLAKGEDVLIIESNPDNKYLPAVRAFKASVLIGDATFQHYLVDAGVGRAKALISAVDGDYVNLEIGQNARAENPHIRLLLRIRDSSTADEMKKWLNIHFVFSKSYSAAQVICDKVCQLLNRSVVLAQK